MNTKIFNNLMKEPGMKQEPSEWKIFLEFCSMYLKAHRIKNPVVVELGVGNQKNFWKQLFDAKYTNISDTRDPHRMKALKTKLKKGLIDILFIDGSHTYDDVRKDFILYAPLCKGIVALQAIETFRFKGRKSAQVWKFWDELKAETHKGVITIFHRRTRGCQRGIGIIIK